MADDVYRTKFTRRITWDGDTMKISDSVTDVWNDAVSNIRDGLDKQMENVVCNHFDIDMSDLRAYMHDKIAWERKQELAIPRWIPVTKRLPENGFPVNIVWLNHQPESYYSIVKDKPFVATGIYRNGAWYWWSATTEDYLNEYGECEWDKVDPSIEITYWMPIPEPPKEEDDED